MPMAIGIRRRFQFSWSLTLATLAALGVLIALGTWQVERMHWKHALIEERAQRLAAPPLILPANIAIPGALDFRRVQATGVLLNERELYLANRVRNGQPGYHVITPLQRADGSAVMVDRGWVPLDRKLPQSRADGQIADTVVIQGIARLPPTPSWLMPKNQVEGNFWFTVDLAAMARADGLPAPGHVVPLHVGAAPDGGYRVAGKRAVLVLAGCRETGDDPGRLCRAAAGVVAGGRAVVLSGNLHVRPAGQPGHPEDGRVAARRKPHLVAVLRQPGGQRPRRRARRSRHGERCCLLVSHGPPLLPGRRPGRA